jgi:hypothetical protein
MLAYGLGGCAMGTSAVSYESGGAGCW